MKCFAPPVFHAVVIVAACSALQGARAASDGLRVGAAVVDISPLKFPVIVNGMFEERTADRAVDPINARAFVLDDGATRIAIVVVDSCMLPRELLDEAKGTAARRTGIVVEKMLISATHTHSAPAAMGCLGSRADPDYPAFLIPRIARAIELANERLRPARMGFAKARAPKHTFCRSYIRRPDRVLKDPFGELTVRANMHPGFLSPDAIGPSGPVDDELSVLAFKTRDGKPLGVLANFSMHYIGSPMVSSDYFGRFAEHLGKKIDGGDGSSGCVVSMSQGTSGDLASMNYSAAQNSREYDSYASELAELAYGAWQKIKYDANVSLAMRESTLELGRRVPSAERLEWAKMMAAKIGERRPKGWPDVYALEQIMLAAEPRRELKLQAVRIGDVAIAAIPDEVFAITGLKLKLQSPLVNTFNMELANGAEGYIPPPEQHKLGGYTSWAARTAGLEEQAEPQIVEELVGLLEEVAGRPRRRKVDSGGAYASAVMDSRPVAYWRLWDIDGSEARDASGNGAVARYEGGYAHFLPGPAGRGMSAVEAPTRATHFAGGRLRAEAPKIGDAYSVEFWFWNGLPNDARATTGTLFSRETAGEGGAAERLVIGGKRFPGKLCYFSGEKGGGPLFESEAAIEPRTWNHVALARYGKRVTVYLNGRQTIAGDTGPVRSAAEEGDWFFAGGNEVDSNLEGKLSEVALYDRLLAREEAEKHYRAANVSLGK